MHFLKLLMHELVFNEQKTYFAQKIDLKRIIKTNSG